jgi:hypothetical protein
MQLSSQSDYGPHPYIGSVTRDLFPGPGHNFMLLPTQSTPATLGVGVTPTQKQPVSHNAHGAYPYLPFSPPPFDSSSPPPTNMLQGQPTIGNSDMHLDWLSFLAEAPNHRYTSANPSILVSPADGNYSTITGPTKVVPEGATTFFAASAADTIPVHVPRGASGSPFNNSLGASAGLTPTFSSTPSTFDFSASPGLTQPSPAAPCTIRPLTEEGLEGEQGLDLVGLFSRPPSLPCGNFSIDRPYSKEAPHPPSGGTIPLSNQLAFTDHNLPSEFGIHTAALPLSSGKAPYATGRKEVRFPNQKKVNVVEDMCRWFPEESDFGKLLKRICASEWYHNGELEPTFGSGSKDLTFGLALGFEAGQSILLGFIGNKGKCHYCGRSSPKKDRMVAHVREHLGLRPFVCMDKRCPCKGRAV